MRYTIKDMTWCWLVHVAVSLLGFTKSNHVKKERKRNAAWQHALTHCDDSDQLAKPVYCPTVKGVGVGSLGD